MISIVYLVLGGVFVYLYYTLNDDTDAKTIRNYSNVKCLSGEYHNKIWNEDNDQNVLDTEFVPDMESAVQIANIIFCNKQKQGLFNGYELQQVFYDEDDSVWIISFWMPFDEKNGVITIGSNFNVAISKKNGEILKVWVEE